MKAPVQIFLSYARPDEGKVKNLYQKLFNTGFKPWMDRMDIVGGERWELGIQRAIQSSDFFLVCLSENSLTRRGYIQKEIEVALDIVKLYLRSDIYLIPVRLEECRVPYELRDFQWVNLFEEDGWTRLVEAMRVGMERRSEPTKPVVQEFTPFELYPTHKRPFHGAEMAASQEGPEPVRGTEMPRKRVRVLVLGGRLTPSLVAVLSNPPDAIEFIVSRDTPERYDQARSVLAEPLDKQLPASPLPAAPPFEWGECQDRCRRAVERHAGAEITFDVTTAPKFMSFAVQDFARCHDHEVVVVDTAKGHEVSLINQQPRPVACPQTVHRYLELFGRELRPPPAFDIAKLSIGEQQARQVAQELAQGGEAAARALNKFNRWKPGKHGALITPPPKELPTTDDEEYAVFQMLAKHGLITDLRREADGVTSYRTSQESMDTQFVVGRWLEVYVWDVARSLRDKTTGEPLFSDCQMSFEIPDPSGQKREVDVGCIYQGQFIHCSCKARAPEGSFDKRHLDEMTGVSKLLGGDFTTRVFVTNAFQPYDKDQWMFAKQAEKQKIVLVTGDELPGAGEILRCQAIEPKYARI